MLVLVTGGAGKVGRETVAALKRAGHRTLVWDVRPRQGAPATPVDCTDFGQVMGAMSGYGVTGPTSDLSPIGVEKQSFVSGLFADLSEAKDELISLSAEPRGLLTVTAPSVVTS